MPQKPLSEIQIKDIMTTKIIAAEANDSILDVARLMVERNFDGVPIVDQNHKLVGMVTMKELLDKKGLYLPTVVQLLNELKVRHADDVAEVEEKLKVVKNLKVLSVMNPNPLYLEHNISLDKAAEAFLLKREDPLPVVDSFKTLVGIVSKYDVLKALTQPVGTLLQKPELDKFTIESKPAQVVEDLEKKFIVVSRERLHFWYIALLVFLALGALITIAWIIRIRVL